MAALANTIIASTLLALTPVTALGQSVIARSATATPPDAALAPATDLGGYRLPLLREGSVIARVVGDLTQDPDEKLWLFRPSQPELGGLRREFVLMPCPVLEDMLQTLRLSPSPVEFEMTGRVFIYRGRNFLLAELAPAIIRFDTAPGATPTITSSAQPTPNGAAKFVAPAAKPPSGDSEDATVDEIERRLEERIGRTPTARLPEPAVTRNARTAATSVEVPTGTRFVLRRGRLLRDPQAGSWRFVPEQSTGMGDPSLELLPCLLLERLENDARQSESPPTVLLSGIVMGFEGQSYLLPSNFRRSREGRGISQ
ncbi:MAG: hypothetical protein DWH97_11605 [Planctomycetota bacterium]|jgi:hypothetical protein|nr:MAG: hypothetical protein DWH97_11605 [Planctomycetota bacterium]